MMQASMPGVFSIPGVEMRAATDYPPSKAESISSRSPDMKTPSAKLAGQSHGAVTDEIGVRSSGGPQNPYDGKLGVPRGSQKTLANKNIIRPSDGNGGIPQAANGGLSQISQEAMRSGSNQFMETAR